VVMTDHIIVIEIVIITVNVMEIGTLKKEPRRMKKMKEDVNKMIAVDVVVVIMIVIVIIVIELAVMMVIGAKRAEIKATKNEMNVMVPKTVDVHMKMINIDGMIIIVVVITMIGIGIVVRRLREKGMVMINTGQIIAMVIDILKNHPNMNGLVVGIMQKIENIKNNWICFIATKMQKKVKK
jgi:magnesium-transporting ATPase (P-type)